MAAFKKFEDIESWKKARELTKRVYRASRKVPSHGTLACAIRCAEHPYR